MVDAAFGRADSLWTVSVNFWDFHKFGEEIISNGQEFCGYLNE
jgi:hypothetical protein